MTGSGVHLIVTGDGWARFGGRSVPAALGRAGMRQDKREGDGATPIGSFLCRAVLWRPDRLEVPATALPTIPLHPDSGWCDDAADPLYNRAVNLPYPGRCEALWREDAVYDLIVPLGYNDDAVVPGRGSAIFLHVAREGFPPTEGCVALALPDLLDFLALAGPQSLVIVGPAQPAGE